MRIVFYCFVLLFSFPAWGTAWEFDPDISAFPKWPHAMEGLGLQEPQEAALHPVTLAQLKRIQTRINKVKYADDLKTYHQLDYWATPAEFYENGGDCEDYAIAKYDALLQLGVPDKDMLIVVVNAKKTRRLHALLEVTLRGKTYLLDNLSDAIHGRNYLKNFTPWYGINRLGWVREV